MGKSGKNKGSQFERDMCKVFSLWASKGEDDDWFWRTPGSGGRATSRAKRDLNAEDYAGDMMSLDVRGRILTGDSYFEFKKGYPETSITSMVDKLSSEKDPIIIRWWKKLEEERILHNKKRGFLVFKRNRKETCIAMSSKTWLFDIEKPPECYILVRYRNLYLSITRLDDFFRMVNVEQVCDIKHFEEVVKLSVRRKPKLKYRRKQ